MSLFLDAVVGVRCEVVEELREIFVGKLGGGGLFYCKVVEGNKNLVVNSTTIVKEGAGNGLHLLDAGFVELCTGVEIRSKLLFGAVDNIRVVMWQELTGTWSGVAPLAEEVFNSFPAKWFLLGWLSAGIFTYVLWSKTLHVGINTNYSSCI